MPSSFLDLFSESPYAAALSPPHLRSYCSNCFLTAKSSCGKCKSVVYCGKECQKEDWPWHKAECAAFVRRRGQSTAERGGDDVEKLDDDEFVRIVGRTLVRLRNDRGEVKLSENFPRFAKDRSFNDLMSHVDDFDQSFLNDIVKDFRRFFYGSQQFDAISDSILRLTMGRIMINDFSISGQPNAHGVLTTLGVGLYLNASRFNHTCERDPKVVANFDGNRIIFRYVLRGNDDKAPTTEKGFNALTFSYGFGDTFWTALPFIQQRRDSLQRNYFFDCRCPRCEDQTDAVLSWDSSSIECAVCMTPLLLDGAEPGRLLALCKCKLDADKLEAMKIWVEDEIAQDECKQLQTNWKPIMDNCISSQSPLEVVATGEPIRLLAERYWHSTFNLQFAQLNELLFAAYRALALSQFRSHWLFDNETTELVSFRFDIPEKPVSSRRCPDVPCTCDLRMALRIGEMLHCCLEYQLIDYDYHLSLHSGYLGELYELAWFLMPTCVLYQALAVQYYSIALDTWLRRDWKHAEKYAAGLRFRLDRVAGFDTMAEFERKADQGEPSGTSDHIATSTSAKSVGEIEEKLASDFTDMKLEKEDGGKANFDLNGITKAKPKKEKL